MPVADRFGLPLTAASPEAAANYIAGLDLLLTANIGAEALLDAAIAADPDFALAHVARARLLQQQARGTEAKSAAVRARSLRDRVTPRERRHVETVALAVDGAAADAMALLEAQVREYPRDALVLSLALGVYGLFGFSGRRDFPEAQLALLERLMPQWGDDWWFLGYLGWSHIETGAVAQGSRIVERSLAGNPRNAYAAHARAHGYHEAGDDDGGAAFVDGWLAGYDRASPLHAHISWHLALCELARGDDLRARELYMTNIRPGASQAAPLPSLADAASFLWRWRLYRDTPAHDPAWDEVERHAQRHFPQAGLAFADLHAAFVAAAVEDAESMQQRLEQIRSRERDGRLPQGAVVPVLCDGAAAFGRGDYREAVRLIEPVLAELPRIGGSGAQREVFEDTFISACLRSGQYDKAEARLSARLQRRPSRRDTQWLASRATRR